MREKVWDTEEDHPEAPTFNRSPRKKEQKKIEGKKIYPRNISRINEHKSSKELQVSSTMANKRDAT